MHHLGLIGSGIRSLTIATATTSLTIVPPWSWVASLASKEKPRSRRVVVRRLPGFFLVQTLKSPMMTLTFVSSSRLTRASVTVFMLAVEER